MPKNRIRNTFFDQLLRDCSDIKLYTWQDVGSGAAGYGGAEYPAGSLYPHAVYVGDLDGDDQPELLYLTAILDQGEPVGCTLKMFKYDKQNRTVKSVYSSPTWADPTASCLWQLGGESPWNRPDSCWDLKNTGNNESSTFILFTVEDTPGFYALVECHFNGATHTRYLVHMAYDQVSGRLLTVDEPLVKLRDSNDDAATTCWRGNSPIGTEEYERAEDDICQRASTIITFNGTGFMASALEPKLTGRSRGRVAKSFGAALSELGQNIGRRVVFVDNDEIEVLPYDFEELITNHPSREYQPKLAHTLMGLACAAYNKNDLIDSLVSLGCTTDIRVRNYYDDPLDPAYGPDQVAFGIGVGKTHDDKPFAVIVLRGSHPDFAVPLPADWSSNFNMGRSFDHEGLHEGFSTAADEVFEYLESLRYQYGLDSDEATLVICGHSRGAAVGNLLARRLVFDWANPSKLFCYNFSCPDTAHYAEYDWEHSGYCDCIFNISDASDPVSWLPGALGGLSGTASAYIGLKIPFGDVSYDDTIAAWGKFGPFAVFSG